MITNTTSMPNASAVRPQSKSAAVMKLLSRARGATVAEMQTATSWQPHSVRAFLSSLRKAGGNLGKEERKSGETSYRLISAAAGTLGGTPAADTLVNDTVVDRATVVTTAGGTGVDAGAEAGA